MSEPNYDLQSSMPGECPAPELPYRPRFPEHYRPRIGLIGCGGITKTHLAAYREAGWDVAAFCDVNEAAAVARKQEFYPDADVYVRSDDLLARKDVEVVDIALQPEPRPAVIEAALRAGKHVLSQKPFVLDLDVGERLADLADACGCKLAVNQNGRWAPYVSYLRQAIASGLIGKLQSVNMALNWDHTWTKGLAVEKIHHMILYDFAIHWFDMVACFFADRHPAMAFARVESAPDQEVAPPLLVQAIIGYDHGAASLMFDARSKFDCAENITITGSEGTLRARGEICAAHDLTLTTKRGIARIPLEGKWFSEGFRGTMGELLLAIEEDREPANSARNNLMGLALCFAAIRAADTGQPQAPGSIRKIE